MCYGRTEGFELLYIRFALMLLHAGRRLHSVSGAIGYGLRSSHRQEFWWKAWCRDRILVNIFPWGFQLGSEVWAWRRSISNSKWRGRRCRQADRIIVPPTAFVPCRCLVRTHFVTRHLDINRRGQPLASIHPTSSPPDLVPTSYVRSTA